MSKILEPLGFFVCKIFGMNSIDFGHKTLVFNFMFLAVASLKWVLLKQEKLR